MMSDLQELTDELMLDADFKKEYEALQPERDISRLENGTRNPSLALLNRIAEAVDATLRIEFIPNKKVAR